MKLATMAKLSLYRSYKPDEEARGLLLKVTIFTKMANLVKWLISGGFHKKQDAPRSVYWVACGTCYTQKKKALNWVVLNCSLPVNFFK